MNPIHGMDEQAGGVIPSLSIEQMVEVDRAMVEDFGTLLLQMMELAGRHLAHLARERFLAGDARGHDVVVLAGTGGNGGGALVCARRLAGWGAPSGLDGTTGTPGDPTIEATATLTLALPKHGLTAVSARPYVGEPYLADIGVPPQLYARPRLGITLPPVFAVSDLVRLR